MSEYTSLRSLFLGARPIIKGLLFGDSFDHYFMAMTDKYDQAGSGMGSGISLDWSPFALGGMRAAYQSTFYSYARKMLPFTNHYIIGFRFMCDLSDFSTFTSTYEALNAPAIISLDANSISTGTEALVILMLRSNGALAVWDGSGVSVSAAGVIAPGQEHYIEAAIFLDDSAGTIVLRVDGAEVLNLTGRNTASISYDTGYLRLGNGAGGANPYLATSFWWHDLYVTDGSIEGAGFLGDTYVLALVPIDVGTYSEWIPIPAGFNFDNVSQDPPYSDYVETPTTATYRDTYQITGFDPINIKGVQFVMGVYDPFVSFQGLVRQGGVDATTLDIPYSGGRYSILPTLVNPATGNIWALADFYSVPFGGAEFGMQSTGIDWQRVYQYVIEVFADLAS
jgi:hypothetical protein